MGKIETLMRTFDIFQVVKTPMDLGTIRQKIDDGVYVKKEEATTDLMLVWDNAMTFNRPEHFVHQVRMARTKSYRPK